MNTCRLIIAATYVWSGLAKLNPNFARDIFPSLVSAFVRMSPSAVQWSVRHLAWMPGLLECAMGVGLVVRAFRRPAAVCAIGMHVLILAVIGPLGSRFNAVVWPWNLAMIFLVSLLFLASGERPPAGDIVWGKGFAFQRIVLVLFGVMPALSFFNLWDAYLSSALYSANRNSGVVYITDDVFYRLPRAIRSYISDEGPNRGGLDIDEWSWGELNVPSYPELRIYRNVARLICGYSRDNTGVELVFQGRLALAGGNRRSVYDCAELVGEPDPSTGLAFR